MPKSPRDEAKMEQEARERGESLPHYAKKVAQALIRKRKRGKVTPSKRG